MQLIDLLRFTTSRVSGLKFHNSKAGSHLIMDTFSRKFALKSTQAKSYIGPGYLKRTRAMAWVARAVLTPLPRPRSLYPCLALPLPLLAHVISRHHTVTRSAHVLNYHGHPCHAESLLTGDHVCQRLLQLLGIITSAGTRDLTSLHVGGDPSNDW